MIDHDRYLVTLACFLIACKLTSTHVKSETLVEFYYKTRPISKLAKIANTQTATPSSVLIKAVEER